MSRASTQESAAFGVRVADEGVALSDAPAGCRAKLAPTGFGGGRSATLEAMGLTADEVVLVHKCGEPTIVSLGTWNGRRIGLTRRAARDVRVVIDG